MAAPFRLFDACNTTYLCPTFTSVVLLRSAFPETGTPLCRTQLSYLLFCFSPIAGARYIERCRRLHADVDPVISDRRNHPQTRRHFGRIPCAKVQTDDDQQLLLFHTIRPWRIALFGGWLGNLTAPKMRVLQITHGPSTLAAACSGPPYRDPDEPVVSTRREDHSRSGMLHDDERRFSTLVTLGSGQGDHLIAPLLLPGGAHVVTYEPLSPHCTHAL